MLQQQSQWNHNLKKSPNVVKSVSMLCKQEHDTKQDVVSIQKIFHLLVQRRLLGFLLYKLWMVEKMWEMIFFYFLGVINNEKQKHDQGG